MGDSPFRRPSPRDVLMTGWALHPPNSEQLSDAVIGSVVQRSRTSERTCSSSSRSVGPPDWETHEDSTRSAESNAKAREEQHVATAELVLWERQRLRELRRLRQVRYRRKKDKYMHSLEEETAQLRRSIDQLERCRWSVSTATLAGQSAWSVVAAYFRLFRYGWRECAVKSPWGEAQPSTQSDFLRASMAADVAFNTARGVDTMRQSWQRLSHWFPGLELELEHLHKDEAGPLVASTTTTVTFSQQTLRLVFPHLHTSDDSRDVALRNRLVGQTIVMRGWARFEWDGRITSAVSESDMLTPMLSLLGCLGDVARVFEAALLTPEFQLKTPS
ncbi:hypothetical protein PHYPSEUDO_015187 [Phytophthora pseudosyringae]|uniref:Bzip transcription factor n=1 Tax=Phytophthora pseudosyringae TaxID=221518 RepID=A0A8T1V650_9STRA|nr:hypothetical protein PHYPSEUDO_015187 [Phytophthora pseudosyringae]